MSKNTDFISGQSECSDCHNELDDPKLDNHELDNPYTGCLILKRKILNGSEGLKVQ